MENKLSRKRKRKKDKVFAQKGFYIEMNKVGVGEDII